MAQVEKTSKEIFLARPTLSANSFTSQSPLTASIEPVVLFSILDHALRRNANQKRVIGTMLGVRSDDGTEIEIRNCFAVPHNESSEQVSLHFRQIFANFKVEVDMEYHKQLLTLHLRQNPKEVLIGWCIFFF
jgi:translation initiation factor 3 subunit F